MQQTTLQTNSPAIRQSAKAAVPPPSPSKKALNKIVDVFTKVLWCDEPDRVIKALDAAVAFCNSAHATVERDSLSKVGMHAIIVGVMNRHVDNVKIQIRCCYLLILALRLRIHTQDTIGIVGGLCSVLVAMETYPEHATLQSNGCVFLFEYFRDNTDYEEFLRVDGPSMLIEAVDKHPTVEALQHSACGVIGNMATANQEICTRFINLGGIVRVALCLQNFPDKPELQQVACDTMTILMSAQKATPTPGNGPAKTEKVSQ